MQLRDHARRLVGVDLAQVHWLDAIATLAAQCQSIPRYAVLEARGLRPFPLKTYPPPEPFAALLQRLIRWGRTRKRRQRTVTLG